MLNQGREMCIRLKNSEACAILHILRCSSENGSDFRKWLSTKLSHQINHILHRNDYTKEAPEAGGSEEESSRAVTNMMIEPPPCGTTHVENRMRDLETAIGAGGTPAPIGLWTLEP